MASYGKIELSPNRHDWYPTPLPEQVVLVTTTDSEKQPHVATKSRVSVISYGPPTIVVFACRAEYPTAANIKENRDFVINIPGDDLVATSWVIGSEPTGKGSSIFEENGITSIPSIKVQAPRLAECRAHLECELEHTHRFGEDLVVFGKVVSHTINSNVFDENQEICYQQLAPFFFLDSNWTASLGTARRVDEPRPGPDHNGTVLTVRDLQKSVDFYSRAFDWTVARETAERVEFDLPHGRTLALCGPAFTEKNQKTGRNGRDDRNATAIELHFQCNDLARTLAKLASAGAQELMKLGESDSGEKSASFADPEGNVLVITHNQRIES